MRSKMYKELGRSCVFPSPRRLQTSSTRHTHTNITGKMREKDEKESDWQTDRLSQWPKSPHLHLQSEHLFPETVTNSSSLSSQIGYADGKKGCCSWWLLWFVCQPCEILWTTLQLGDCPFSLDLSHVVIVPLLLLPLVVYFLFSYVCQIRFSSSSSPKLLSLPHFPGLRSSAISPLMQY